jgi:hypothetical protein
MNAPRSPQSQLAPLAHLCREPDSGEARRLAREAYRNTGLILINPSWLISWADRKQAEILAEKVHGKRGQR